MQDVMQLDVRPVEPKDRYERIIGAYESLGVEQALELTVDHDPQCMYYALKATRGDDAFAFEYLERGPETWRVRVKKTAEDRPVRIAKGDLLPPMRLVSAATREPVELRRGTGPQVLVLMHSVTCGACRRYVREELAPVARAIAEWGGRLSVVVAGPLANAATFAETTTDALEVLMDADATLAPLGTAVVVADEWGEVHYVTDADAVHDLPRRDEVLSWVRFLAIQCPECEGPEGAWRTA